MIDSLLDKINRRVPEKWQWILNHGGFRKYFKNTGWMFGGQIIYLILSFLVGAWIARYLGPEKYGTVSYVVAFSGLFSFIASLGIDGILKRELVNTPEKHNQLIGTAFRLKIIGTALAFLMVVVFTLLIPGNSYLSKFLIIGYSLNFFLQIPFLLNNHFYAQVKAKNPVKAQFFTTLISSILKIALILTGQGIIWLIVIYVLDSLWHSLFIIYFYKKDKQKFSNWQYDKMVAKIMLRESWPLMLSAAAVSIYHRIDQVMVGKMMGDYEVGLYAVSVKLTEVFTFIPSIIIGSFFPAIVNAKKTSDKVYNSRLKKLYILLGVLAVLIIIPIVIFANPIINLIFGVDYLSSVPILKWYVFSAFGLFIGGLVSSQLMVEKKTKTVFKINLFAMFINIALNLYLIPRIGLTGAAIATLISYSVSPLYIIFFNNFKKH